MNTKQIEYVLTIASEKNMQKAADILFVSQSALSQSLQKLEDDLGCQLFIRKPREMVPTQEGLIYIEGARKILEIKKETYERIKNLNRTVNQYKIGVSSHEGITRFLDASAKLQSIIPSIDIFPVEDNFRNLITKLSNRELCLLLLTWHTYKDIPFNTEVLYEEEIVLVSKKGHLDSKLGPDDTVRMESLKNEKFILTPTGTTLRDIADMLFSEVAYTPRTICELNNVPAKIDLVISKNAITLLPKKLCHQYEDLNLSFYNITSKPIRYQLLVYRNDAEEDPIMHDIIEAFIEGTSKNLEGSFF